MSLHPLAHPNEARPARRSWRRPLAWILAIFVAALVTTGSFAWAIAERIQRVDPTDGTAFRSPYYLYVSDGAEERADRGETLFLLVLPNNTGRADDDLEVHRRKAYTRLLRDSALARELDVVALVPAFPRPSSSWRVYTHALDRDSLTTDVADLARPDLQLIAMIDDARARLASRGMRVDERVLVKGFSANAMFANRFTALHPERVLACAAGSPGGWPIAPVAEWEGASLRYPVGVADLELVTGRAFDAVRFARTPMLVYMGDRDENDSLDFGDGYDDEDRSLVEGRFGARPIERWPAIGAMYAAAGSSCEFALYAGAGHETTSAMRSDVTAFLSRELERARGTP